MSPLELLICVCISNVPHHLANLARLISGHLKSCFMLFCKSTGYYFPQPTPNSCRMSGATLFERSGLGYRSAKLFLCSTYFLSNQTLTDL
jgi:hypothetical protein